MFSLVSALIFVPCLQCWLIVVLGVNLLRMSFGGQRRRKSAADAQRTDKKNDNRRQRIKSQFKQEGEYVDFEEVPDIITEK